MSRDRLDAMLAYEQGSLSEEEVVSLFQELIDEGWAWKLQGHYGRTAASLIEKGQCMFATEARQDAYGDYVPSRDEVKPGSPGSAEYVQARGLVAEVEALADSGTTEEQMTGAAGETQEKDRGR